MICSSYLIAMRYTKIFYCLFDECTKNDNTVIQILASACAYQKAADSWIDILDGGNTDHNYNFLHPHLLFIYTYSSLKVFIDVERLYLFAFLHLWA